MFGIIFIYISTRPPYPSTPKGQESFGWGMPTTIAKHIRILRWQSGTFWSKSHVFVFLIQFTTFGKKHSLPCIAVCVNVVVLKVYFEFTFSSTLNFLVDGSNLAFPILLISFVVPKRFSEFRSHRERVGFRARMLAWPCFAVLFYSLSRARGGGRIIILSAFIQYYYTYDPISKELELIS